jgi:hypothetical protein
MHKYQYYMAGAFGLSTAVDQTADGAKTVTNQVVCQAEEKRTPMAEIG